MSYDKVEHSRIGSMVKEIDFYYGELVKSICLDLNSSKGRSEEVAKELDV